ncbi:MAG TPA: hypothetical protein VK048_01820 [Atopostipes sp.]|nr:hypothetical protein [Atopostipes sp.]
MMFLVEESKAEFAFPLTSYEKSGTGLASVIEEIKSALRLDIDQLELTELINTVIENQRIPLFVFSYQDEELQLNELVGPTSGLHWQVSDHFTDTLQKYDISGVPNFDRD